MTIDTQNSTYVYLSAIAIPPTKKKKEKLQDMLDTVLTISYPYISGSKGWTNRKTNINSSDNIIKIKVHPQYLPMGEEDASTLTIGVCLDKMEPVKIKIWTMTVKSTAKRHYHKMVGT